MTAVFRPGNLVLFGEGDVTDVGVSGKVRLLAALVVGFSSTFTLSTFTSSGVELMKPRSSVSAVSHEILRTLFLTLRSSPSSSTLEGSCETFNDSHVPRNASSCRCSPVRTLRKGRAERARWLGFEGVRHEPYACAGPPQMHGLIQGIWTEHEQKLIQTNTKIPQAERRQKDVKQEEVRRTVEATRKVKQENDAFGFILQLGPISIPLTAHVATWAPT